VIDSEPAGVCPGREGNLRTVDRVFGWLLALGGVGHGLGSYKAYHTQPATLLWALSASFAGFLLAAVNIVRAGRTHDQTLAWISFAGCLVWTGFVIWFAVLIGNLLDFRALVNLVITVTLAGFSLRSALASRG
jgi:hypothetical protein